MDCLRDRDVSPKVCIGEFQLHSLTASVLCSFAFGIKLEKDHSCSAQEKENTLACCTLGICLCHLRSICHPLQSRLCAVVPCKMHRREVGKKRPGQSNPFSLHTVQCWQCKFPDSLVVWKSVEIKGEATWQMEED